MENNTPKVTVLVSVYNDEKYIYSSIKSILDQTYKDFELLIIDDNSSDKTPEILSGFNDDRIKIYNTGKNIGIPKSLNIGLKLARGKYIARTDSDDLSYPNRLKEQIDFLEKNDQFALMATRTKVIDKDGNLIGFWKQETMPELIFYTLSYTNCLTSSSVIFNKKKILELGGYDESRNCLEDYELWYRVSRKFKIYTLPKYLVKYRKRDLSHSFRHSNELNLKARQLVIENTGIDKFLLEYILEDGEKRKLKLSEKVLLFKKNISFNKIILEEGKKVGFTKNRLLFVCVKESIIFTINFFIPIYHFLD